LLSNIKVIFEGYSWGENPTELSQCTSVLEIHSGEDWKSVNTFLKANKGKHIAFLLSHQLKGLFSDYALQKHAQIDFPLGVFLVFDSATPYTNKNECVSESPIVKLKPSLTKSEYLERISTIKNHIQKGEFYETNFCFEHNFDGDIFPEKVFRQVSKLSNAPFSAHFQYKHHHVISGSPEMFFETEKDAIRCAPIKGTRPRGKNLKEDEALKSELENSLKERAENIMIVDLVRHDLSQIAQKNTVSVDALCKVHTFETVHQLITDISAKLSAGVEFSDVIEKLFPIGSMTGAPKIAAVGYTDNLEPSPRVTYSGALGWIKPNGYITSSVLIRGVYYDAMKKYTSVSVGGAITTLSDPEEEYAECMTKLRMMQEALLGSQ
jgi:para-aminobenzoate synthetase component 1